jgi:endopeptidase La
MIETIKKLKLSLLQKIYKELSLYILNLNQHIIFLYDNFFIEYVFKQNLLNKLNEINKNINTNYNNFIIDSLDKNTELNIFFNQFDLTKLNNNFDDIIDLRNFINFKSIPLSKQLLDIGKIMSSFGYNSLDGLLTFFIGNNYKKIIDSDIITLINEINTIFIPLSIDFFDVNKDESYYWRKPKTFDTNDLLELSRELWIKYYKKYIKITGIFKNDSIGVIFKTSQLNYPILYNYKNKIEENIEQFNIDNKFLKKFIRHDYLGNFYTLSTIEYLTNVKKYYQKYIELSSSTFLIIMKEFLSENLNLKNMFTIIFLLLLGNNETIDIAGLLLGLMKEKKTNLTNIINLVNNNLTFSLQIKLKKSQNIMKNEIERLKELSLEDIDYKKQLVSNKNIPDYVKVLTLEKIQEMKLYNNEYYKQLTFVKHIMNYPWPSLNDDLFYESLKLESKKSINYLTQVEDKLNKLSFGHEEAKKSLLQIIGKWISNPSSQGTSFGLVGPPGVGKTLLAKSVSTALDIPFVQITLGGQNDGELLHGHGYTYSGSQPGLIIKKMVEAGKSRCILYFDELDKTTSKHGNINEITSILIHLTDPNMNKTFQDRFFQGVEFPLDKVIMIFSYNDSSLIDPILLDRLKEINVKSYTTSEKIKIAKEFIIPEMINSIGLQNEDWTQLTDDIIEYIIENYTNEAGVRDIKRYIEKIFLTLNLDKIYQRKQFKEGSIKEITKENINNILQKPTNEIIKILDKPNIGIINGLYATNNGNGGIIPIQIFNNFSSTPNAYEIKLTGKQGDIMKESVHCSLTAAIDYVRRNIKKYPFIKNLDKYLVENFKYGFHIHAPSTSTPKDGPSAGCAFTSAFISRILNKGIRNDVAMTGEIELTGRITKIGGLNFKLIGAKKACVKLVFIPKDNENDLEEIKQKYPKLIDDTFEVKIFEYIDDIIDIILV